METGINISIKIPVWLDIIFAWPAVLYRLWKYGYTYRRIYLGEDEWTILDQQDYCRLKHFKWVINGNGTKFYAARFIKIGPGKAKIMRLHREIMNPPEDLLVDHRNGDSLDTHKIRATAENPPRKPHRDLEGLHLKNTYANGAQESNI